MSDQKRRSRSQRVRHVGVSWESAHDGLQCQRRWLRPPVAGHYIENTGDTDLVFLEMFQGRPIHRLLHEQLDQTSPSRDGDSHLNIDEVTVKKIPIENRAVIAG